MQTGLIQLLSLIGCHILRLKQLVFPLTIFSIFITYHLYKMPYLTTHTFPDVLNIQTTVGKQKAVAVSKEKREKTTRRKFGEFFVLKKPNLEQFKEETKLLQILVDGPDGTNATFCPKIPSLLKGIGQVRREHYNLSVLSTIFPEMHGWYNPITCRARQRIAVIVPYRKANNPLIILLHNLIPLLQRQMLDFTIYIIEQALPSRFNRAALFNIGFLEASRRREYDCYVFHDVDMIPVDDRHSYTCGSQPRHLIPDLIGLEDNLGEVYPSSSDGILLFTRDQYRRINGASNSFFGVHGEVYDLWKRIYGRNMQVVRELVRFEKYSTIQSKTDYSDSFRKTALKSTLARIDDDGLNTVNYQIVNIKTTNLFLWFNVQVHESLHAKLKARR